MSHSITISYYRREHISATKHRTQFVPNSNYSSNPAPKQQRHPRPQTQQTKAKYSTFGPARGNRQTKRILCHREHGSHTQIPDEEEESPNPRGEDGEEEKGVGSVPRSRKETEEEMRVQSARKGGEGERRGGGGVERPKTKRLRRASRR